MQNYLAILIFSALGVRVIAVGFLHLLVMDVGDLQLRFSRFRHVGEEDLEIVVFLLGLRQRGSSTFRIPGIADCQLGARDEFRIRIGVDQRLERQPRHVETIVPHRVHGLVEQHLVGLLRTHAGQRVDGLLVGAGNSQAPAT